VSLDFSYVGFFIIEMSILAGLIYGYKSFSKVLKAYHTERYIKVKREMEYFMIVWTIPLFLSILIRFVLIIESIGLAKYADSTENFWRTLQTINLGFLYMFQSYGILLLKGSNDPL
jgi:hypothetical protein